MINHDVIQTDIYFQIGPCGDLICDQSYADETMIITPKERLKNRINDAIRNLKSFQSQEKKEKSFDAIASIQASAIFEQVKTILTLNLYTAIWTQKRIFYINQRYQGFQPLAIDAKKLSNLEKINHINYILMKSKDPSQPKQIKGLFKVYQLQKKINAL